MVSSLNSDESHIIIIQSKEPQECMESNDIKVNSVSSSIAQVMIKIVVQSQTEQSVANYKSERIVKAKNHEQISDNLTLLLILLC